MNPKIDNIVRIPCTIENNFFRYWISFLRPLHNLNRNETEVFACFLKKRYELGKDTTNDSIIDQILMNRETKRSIREECNLSESHFSLVMKNLKKKKIIIDNKVNPRFIPKIIEERGMFQLLLVFDFKST